MIGKVVVRKIPNSYPGLYLPKGIHIDLNLAREQHNQYIKALLWLGLNVEVVPADEKYPDCVFIEDTAVIHRNRALITHMGSKYRRGEIEETKKYFQKTHELFLMKSPALLESGDILVTKNEVYVGISNVTNNLALEYLKIIFDSYTIIPVPVTKTLHLKSACSYIGKNTILICEDLLKTNQFNQFDKILVPKEESYACNCIAFNNKVLVPEGAEKTISMIKNKGFKIKTVPISEFLKGEGSLTCLSIIY